MLNGLHYLAFNPVRAGLAQSPADWPWPGVAAHLWGRDDALVRVAPVLEIVPDFALLLEMSLAEAMEMKGFETKSANGHPAGTPEFIAMAEAKLGRNLQPGRPGPKRRDGQS